MINWAETSLQMFGDGEEVSAVPSPEERGLARLLCYVSVCVYASLPPEGQRWSQASPIFHLNVLKYVISPSSLVQKCFYLH